MDEKEGKGTNKAVFGKRQRVVEKTEANGKENHWQDILRLGLGVQVQVSLHTA
jgi:hypothetical protein